MRRTRTRAVLVVAALALLGAGPASLEDDRSAVARRALVDADRAVAVGAFERADAILERAGRADPGFVDLSFHRARTAAAAGDPERALALLDPFLARSPEHVEARLLRARLRSATGRFDAASRDYAEVIRREPGSLVYAEAARLLIERGEAGRAAARRLLERAEGEIGALVALEALREQAERDQRLQLVGAPSEGTGAR